MKISLKTYCCFFIFLFAIHISSAQLSVFERIDKQFELSISEKNDEKRIDLSFVSIDPQESILDDRVYINYLYTNFRSKSIDKYPTITDEISDDEAITRYRNTIKNDSLFVHTINDISQNVNQPIAEKPVYTLSETLDIATKFIKIIDVKENQYVLKVCVGINDLDQTQSIRNAALEAFCFSAILKNYYNKNRPLREEIRKESKKSVHMRMSDEKEDKNLYAKATLFILIIQNETLKHALLNEYEYYKYYLPLKLQANQTFATLILTFFRP